MKFEPDNQAFAAKLRDVAARLESGAWVLAKCSGDSSLDPGAPESLSCTIRLAMNPTALRTITLEPRGPAHPGYGAQPARAETDDFSLTREQIVSTAALVELLMLDYMSLRVTACPVGATAIRLEILGQSGASVLPEPTAPDPYEVWNEGYLAGCHRRGEARNPYRRRVKQETGTEGVARDVEAYQAGWSAAMARFGILTAEESEVFHAMLSEEPRVIPELARMIRERQQAKGKPRCICDVETTVLCPLHEAETAPQGAPPEKPDCPDCAFCRAEPSCGRCHGCDKLFAPNPGEVV